LKNPAVSGLQLTMENLVPGLRSGSRVRKQFEEVFREKFEKRCWREIANLKGIIGRFSEFSEMPQPQLQPVQLK